MDIIISNSSEKPIYDQIASQIKGMIMSGELKEGEMLPSIRMLAKNLRISVITTKRAYEELELAGFLVTVAGKGSFVAKKNLELIREEQIKLIEGYFTKAIEVARSSNFSLEELETILKTMYGVN